MDEQALTQPAESANDRWARLLAAWTIPEEIRAAAPASPYYFDIAVFAAAADEALARRDDTVSDMVARAVLPPGGTVLDVGVGVGAASLRLGAGRIVGVDSDRRMLDAFAERATARGVDHVSVDGRWPDVAPMTPTVDVAVCHHVVFNVPDLASFAAAIDAKADRVVMEFTTEHPTAWMSPYWEALHGWKPPAGPTADDVVAVFTELGFRVEQRRWRRPYQMAGEASEERVVRLARRLCLPPDRHSELRRMLEEVPPPTDRDVATLWW